MDTLSQSEIDTVGIDRLLNDLGSGASHFYIGRLQSLNEIPVYGFGLFVQFDDSITAHIHVGGLEAGGYHELQIHGFSDGTPSSLATASNDLDGDDYIEQPEEEHAVGPELLSLDNFSAASVGAPLTSYPYTAVVGDPNDPNAYYGYHIDEDRNYSFSTPPSDGSSPASAALLLQTTLEGRAFDVHGVNLPPGEGAGTAYEVNGTGGFIAPLPVAQSIIHEVSLDQIESTHYDTITTDFDSFHFPVNLDNVTYTGTGNFTAIGNDTGNVIQGGPGSDYLIGQGGDDVLIGHAGAPDTLQGGVGNDTYVVEASGTSIIENPNEGNDTVETSLASFILPDNVENLIHTGSASFTGIGNAADNSISGANGNNYLIGLDGNDTLISGPGSDTLQGGPGDDIYAIQSNSDTVFENANEGFDTVETFIASFTLPANVEKLVFVGDTNHSGVGNAGNNVFVGAGGTDTWTGNGGQDVYFRGTPGGGLDIVTDFDPVNSSAGHDLIDLRGLNAKFSDLSLTAVDGGTTVGIPGGGAMFLEGVAPNQIDKGDFLFA